MLRKRIIARLDIKGPNVIKGVHLECLRKVGDPQQLSTKYYNDGIDEILYIDVVASLYGRKNLTQIVKRASENIFVPLTVGGGVRSIEDINELLRSGADKIAINSHLIQHPDFVDNAAKRFGSQCIVGSIEAKRKGNAWEPFYNNGREPSHKNVLVWAKELVDRGVGELLITSIDQEGTCRGFDIELMKKISTAVNVPVIASGGAGNLEDIEEVISSGGADAVAIAHLLHYGKLNIKEIKNVRKIFRENTMLRVPGEAHL